MLHKPTQTKEMFDRPVSECVSLSKYLYKNTKSRVRTCIIKHLKQPVDGISWTNVR